MDAHEGPFAVLGPTGFTGRLVCAAAREAGLPLRLVGRNRKALEALAEPGEEVRLADAQDEAALVDAFEGASVVASLAGPFLAVGPRPVAAAIAAGAHYVDTSGEQAFARLVHEDFGARASKRGVVLLTSFGFDFVPGDLAARLAADGLEPLDEVIVAYSVAGMALSLSPGTLRTMARVMTQGHMAFENGALVPSRFGRTATRVRFPFGERGVVEWSGTEPLTVPRHTETTRVRSYIRAPRLAGRLGRAGRLAAPFVGLYARVARPPSRDRLARVRWTVVAEARGPAAGRRATLSGRDVYGLTALLVVRAAASLAKGEVDGTGALAPAEAFDAPTLLERLRPLADAPIVQEF